MPLPSTLPKHLPPQLVGQLAQDAVVIWKQPLWTHSYPAGQFVALQPSNSQLLFTQVPPGAQQVPSQGTAHAPSQQAQPDGQAWPQAAQFPGSVWRLTHSSPQQVSPAEQVPQAMVPPQPSLSVPHWPGWHVAGVQQLPALQTWPGTHVLSQIPQFSGSVWRSVHRSPQQVCPASQHSPEQHDSTVQQVPPSQQIVPDGQQTGPQHCWLLGQQSAPLQQFSPAAHLPPVPPQGGPWHCPVCVSQVSPFGQVPQEPPHPSGPHCLPWQSGVHWHRPP